MDISREVLKEKTSNLLSAPRVAPLGVFLASFNLAAGSANIADGLETSDIGIVPVSTAGIFVSGIIIAKQLKLKHRLEKQIERQGFNERLMEPTTKFWCDRQTTRVVCEESGNLGAYKNLCERNKEYAKFTWLPHF